jgi:hypothetical protein
MNWQGNGIPASGWPGGCGYTHYKWRLNAGAWSAETPIALPVFLSGLSDGPHYVEVVGKRDSGYYQDDPAFGPEAVITRSRTWNVQTKRPLRITAESAEGADFTLHFVAEAGQAYTVQYTDLLTSPEWFKAADIAASPATGDCAVTNLPIVGRHRFYRIVRAAP